jgi:hypothetical protein
MSFFCHATQGIVHGESCVLVPIGIRRVKYIGTMTRKNRRDDQPVTIYTGDSEGWEIAKELPICASKAQEFAEKNPPRVDKLVKEIKFYRRKQKKDSDQYDEPSTNFHSRSVREDSIEQIEIGREF